MEIENNSAEPAATPAVIVPYFTMDVVLECLPKYQAQMKQAVAKRFDLLMSMADSYSKRASENTINAWRKDIGAVDMEIQRYTDMIMAIEVIRCYHIRGYTFDGLDAMKDKVQECCRIIVENVEKKMADSTMHESLVVVAFANYPKYATTMGI